MFSAKNIIVLSQTYYIKEKGNKIYLQEAIKNNDIFKDIKFWDKLFEFFIEKEKQRLKKSINLNDINDGENNKSKVAFGQLMTICNNMMEFGLNKSDIYKVIEPKIKDYKLDENSINNIKLVLDLDKQNNNK